MTRLRSVHYYTLRLKITDYDKHFLVFLVVMRLFGPLSYPRGVKRTVRKKKESYRKLQDANYDFDSQILSKMRKRIVHKRNIIQF